MERGELDIIKVADVLIVCEECGEDIAVGSLVNEFNEDKESVFYCMKCLPRMIKKNAVWWRG